MARWQVEESRLKAAAIENLRAELSRSGDDLFQSMPFGPAGRVGQLGADVAPAVILLPEFLARVRQAWQVEDDLAILAVSRTDVRFVESKNTKLLDLLYPIWKEQVDRSANALSKRVLLLSQEGLTLYSTYNPPVRIDIASTQPFAPPAGSGARPGVGQRPGMPTTRPTTPARPMPQRPYIVR